MMLRSVQPQFSFKSIEGTYSRDPLRLGKPCNISADGKYIFSISDAEEDHETLPLASATVHSKTGGPVSSIKTPSLVNCGALSGDGTIALVGTNSGCLDLWNARTGYSLAHKQRNEKAICDLSLSPPADTFASTTFGDASVYLWDSNYMRITQEFPKILEQPSRGGLVSLQGNGRKVFACDFKKVHVLDCSMQREAYSIKVSDTGVVGSFINDCSSDRYGRTMAAIHWAPNQLCLWDMRMRKIRSKIRLKGNQGFGTVRITPDGGRVVVSTYSPDVEDRIVALVDTSTERITHNLIHGDGRTISSCISADGRTVATLSKDGITRVFDLKISQRRVMDSIDIGPRGSILTFGSDIQRLFDRAMTNWREFPTIEEVLAAIGSTEKGHAVRNLKDIYYSHILIRTTLSQTLYVEGQVLPEEMTDICELLWKNVYRKTPVALENQIQNRLTARQIIGDAFDHNLISKENMEFIRYKIRPLPMEKSRFSDIRPFIRSLTDGLVMDLDTFGEELEKMKSADVNTKHESMKILSLALIPFFVGTFYNHVPSTGPLLCSLEIQSLINYVEEKDTISLYLSEDEESYSNNEKKFIKLLISEKYLKKVTTQKGKTMKNIVRQKIIEIYSSVAKFESELR